MALGYQWRGKNLSEEIANSMSLSRQLCFDLMMVDLDLAQTFLDVSVTSTNEGTIRRSRHNAQRAYEVISALLDKRDFGWPERETIEGKLQVLGQRLREVCDAENRSEDLRRRKSALPSDAGIRS